MYDLYFFSISSLLSQFNVFRPLNPLRFCNKAFKYDLWKSNFKKYLDLLIRLKMVKIKPNGIVIIKTDNSTDNKPRNVSLLISDDRVDTP